MVLDIARFVFLGSYDVVIAHGVLHLLEPHVRVRLRASATYVGPGFRPAHRFFCGAAARALVFLTAFPIRPPPFTLARQIYLRRRIPVKKIALAVSAAFAACALSAAPAYAQEKVVKIAGFGAKTGPVRSFERWTRGRNR